ncbi:MAG TPA: hypothetical protein PKZ97_18195, partial [Azospirillaceae bacterium]|nr:hypothetical protein [Azospirillaceae bacterium]
MTESAASLWTMATNPYVVAAVIGGNSLAIALSVLFSAGAYPQPFSRALTYFGTGKLITASGFAFIALRGEFPFPAMVIAGNILAFTGFCSNLLALWTLQHKPIRWFAPLSLLAANVAATCWFTLGAPDANMLRVSTGLLSFMLSAVLAVELLFRFNGGGRAHLLGGALAVAMALASLARIASALNGGVLPVGQLSLSWVERAFFAMAYIVATMSALNFSMLSNDAFNGELRRMAASDPLTGLPNRRRLM